MRIYTIKLLIIKNYYKPNVCKNLLIINVIEKGNKNKNIEK